MPLHVRWMTKCHSHLRSLNAFSIPHSQLSTQKHLSNARSPQPTILPVGHPIHLKRSRAHLGCSMIRLGFSSHQPLSRLMVGTDNTQTGGTSEVLPSTIRKIDVEKSTEGSPRNRSVQIWASSARWPQICRVLFFVRSFIACRSFYSAFLSFMLTLYTLNSIFNTLS